MLRMRKKIYYSVKIDILHSNFLQNPPGALSRRILKLSSDVIEFTSDGEMVKYVSKHDILILDYINFVS